MVVHQRIHRFRLLTRVVPILGLVLLAGCRSPWPLLTPSDVVRVAPGTISASESDLTTSSPPPPPPPTWSMPAQGVATEDALPPPGREAYVERPVRAAPRRGGPAGTGWLSGQLSASHVLSSDIDGEDASFGLTKAGVALQAGPIGVTYERLRLHWDRAETLAISGGSRRPVEDLHQMDVQVQVPIPVSERVMGFVGGGVNMAWEDELSRSFAFQAQAGVRWQISRRWSATAGLAWTHHPQVDVAVPVFPVVSLDWNADAERGWSASIGLPGEIRYAFNRNTSIALGGFGEGGVFRLANDNVAAPGGYFELTQFGIGLELRHRFARRWNLSAQVAYVFESELRFFDRDGDRLTTHRTGDAVAFALRLGAEL